MSLIRRVSVLALLIIVAALCLHGTFGHDAGEINVDGWIDNLLGDEDPQSAEGNGTSVTESVAPDTTEAFTDLTTTEAGGVLANVSPIFLMMAIVGANLFITSLIFVVLVATGKLCGT